MSAGTRVSTVSRRVLLLALAMIGALLLGATALPGCSSSSSPGVPGTDAGLDVVTHDVTTFPEAGDGASTGDSAADESYGETLSSGE